MFNYQVLKPLGYDSFLLVHFFPIPDLAYMRLSNGDIDTFQISTNTYNASRCCGTVTQLSNFRFNNGIDYSVAPGGVNIKEKKK